MPCREHDQPREGLASGGRRRIVRDGLRVSGCRLVGPDRGAGKNVPCGAAAIRRAERPFRRADRSRGLAVVGRLPRLEGHHRRRSARQQEGAHQDRAARKPSRARRRRGESQPLPDTRRKLASHRGYRIRAKRLVGLPGVRACGAAGQMRADGRALGGGELADVGIVEQEGDVSAVHRFASACLGGGDAESARRR